MSRSTWKGFFIKQSVIKGYKNYKKSNERFKSIKIWSRSSVITRSFLNKNVFIYTGKEFRRLRVTEDKIGSKFGSFCYTRKYKKKIKKVEKKIKKK